MALALRAATSKATFGATSTADNPGTQAGDVVLALFYSDTTIPGTPSGWVAAGPAQTGQWFLQAFTRIAGASEPANWALPGTAGSTSLIGTLVFSGADTTTPIGAYATSSGASTTAQSAPSVTPTRANSMLVNCFAQKSATATHTTVTGATEAFDRAEGSEMSFAADYMLLSTTAATGTQSSTASVAAAYDSLSLVINPAAAADTTAPTTPGSFTATAASTSQINLSWTASTDNVGVDHYEVSRGATVIVPSTTSLSYADTGLAASTAYSYSVVAVDAAGNRSAAATTSTTTLSALTSKLFGGSTQITKLFVGSTAVPRAYLGATLVYQLGGSSTPAPLRTFYVDTTAGNDANNGTSTGTAWQTIGKVNATTFQPGDALYFKAGQTWTGNVVLLGSGTSANPITVGAFGTGAAPIFDAGNSGHAFRVNGSWVTVQDIKVQNAGSVALVGGNGLVFYGADGLAQRVEATNCYVGITAADGAHRLKITSCNIHDNTKLFIGPGTTDDAYANGIGLWAADACDVSYNTISGHYATSPDFGDDGSAIEVYGATNAQIHHNVTQDNQTFAELGRAGTASNTFYDNLITSAQNHRYALTVQGPAGEGPATGTRFINNTVVLTGATGCEAFWVGTGTDLYFHNNIVVCSYIGEADSQLNEGHNVFVGDTSGFPAYAATSTKPANLAAVGFVGSSDYHLATGSPALNRGVAVSFTTDLDNNPRVFGSAPDAGCYERQVT